MFELNVPICCTISFGRPEYIKSTELPLFSFELALLQIHFWNCPKLFLVFSKRNWPILFQTLLLFWRLHCFVFLVGFASFWKQSQPYQPYSSKVSLRSFFGFQWLYDWFWTWRWHLESEQSYCFSTIHPKPSAPFLFVFVKLNLSTWKWYWSLAISWMYQKHFQTDFWKAEEESFLSEQHLYFPQTQRLLLIWLQRTKFGTDCSFSCIHPLIWSFLTKISICCTISFGRPEYIKSTELPLFSFELALLQIHFWNCPKLFLLFFLQNFLNLHKIYMPLNFANASSYLSLFQVTPS